MKTLLITLITFLLLTFNFFPQAPDTMWTKTFGGNEIEEGLSVQQTSDNGYIISGFTNSFGYLDTWLIKTNENGDSLWTKTFGGSGMEVGNCVKQTSDSGYIVFGMTTTFGAGDWDVWLVKTDNYGIEKWSKTFGGESGDMGNSGEQTIDGGYIIVGTTNSFSATRDDIWLIKTDSGGDSIWSRSFNFYSDEAGQSVQQTSDGGYILVGTTSSIYLILIKTDINGIEEWRKTFEGDGFSVQQTFDGGYIITGNVIDYNTQNEDLLLLKTDSEGNELWSKTFDVTSEDIGYSVWQTLDSGYVVTGSIRSNNQTDVLVIKADKSGLQEWIKVIGGNSSDRGACISQTKDGGYVITGVTQSFGAGNRDAWLIKLAPSPVSVVSLPKLGPTNYSLKQNYPNPFNPSTKINWQAPAGSWQTLKIYDVLGDEIATLVDEYKPAGSYEIEWDAGGLPSGIYFYQLRAGNVVGTKKMILMK